MLVERKAEIGIANGTYPIMRSNCSCLMLSETLQSTPPEDNVMANADAISFCIDEGMLDCLLVAPTQILELLRCSNSLAPICEISTPDTSDKITFVGKRCSRWDSTPMEFVVFTRMQVC